MKLDEDKFYIKIISLDAICNFVVENFYLNLVIRVAKYWFKFMGFEI
jgi:hypothetical protein